MEKDNKGKEEQKYTYDELTQICSNLAQQNDYLLKQMKKMDMANMFKRLDYLFEVVKYGQAFPKEFTDKCVKEIEQAITLTEEDKEETKD